VERHGLRSKYPRKISAFTGWGVGGPIPADVVRANRLSLGGFDIAQVVTRMPTLKSGVFASTISSGSIGSGVLKRFRATFDYRGKRLYLAPNASFATADPHDRSGLWLSKRALAFEVMSIVAGGPAADAGIEVGDIVTAIDGRSVADLFLVDERERLKREPVGTVVTLKLARGRDVRLTLRDLL
jgi:membrane-associated protease RseP (regulator of RpoE activity)